MRQTCIANLTGLYEIFNSSSGRIVSVHAGFINDDPLQYLSSANTHILHNHSAATYILQQRQYQVTPPEKTPGYALPCDMCILLTCFGEGVHL